jgi:hypothetical protein
MYQTQLNFCKEDSKEDKLTSSYVCHCLKDKNIMTAYVGRAIPSCTQYYHPDFPGINGEFGNPFPITPKNTREKVIEMYKNHILKNNHESFLKREKIRKLLKGKILGCWCRRFNENLKLDGSNSCHADIIAQIANSTEAELSLSLS